MMLVRNMVGAARTLCSARFLGLRPSRTANYR